MPLGSKDRVYTGRYVHVDFKMNVSGIRKIAVGMPLRKACMEVAAKALPYAVSISPRSRRNADQDPGHPHYQDSFKIDAVYTGIAPESIGNPPMRRIGARLANTARHAVIVEWGKRGQRGRHILRKTLEHLERIRI